MPDRTCIAASEECTKGGRLRRGYCRKHYERVQQHGDPHTKIKGNPPEVRFWWDVDAAGDCWEWAGPKSPYGYGDFRPTRDRHIGAHRYCYQLLVGPVPEGMELDHLCRNRACVNPDHLEPVTHAENMRRTPYSAADFQRAKTHCPEGHPYSGDNLQINSKGRRTCRTCVRAQWEARKAA